MNPERQGTVCNHTVTAPAREMPAYLALASHEVRIVQGECIGRCHAARYSYDHVSGFCLRRAMEDAGLKPNPSFSQSPVCPRE